MSIHKKIYDTFNGEHYDECFRLCEIAINTTGMEDYYPWYFKAKSEYGRNNIEEAINSYETVIRIDSTIDEVWSALGLIYQYKGDKKLALKCYINEVRIFPQNYFAWHKLADFLIVINRKGLAKKIYHMLLEIGKFDFCSSGFKFSEILNADELEEVINKMEKTLMEASNTKGVWSVLGYLYERKEEYKLAMRFFSKEIRLFPNNCIGWHRLANFLTSINRYRLAKKIFSNLLKLDKFNFYISAYQYADALYDAGSLQEELEYYQLLISQGFEETWIDDNYQKILKDIKG